MSRISPAGAAARSTQASTDRDAIELIPSEADVTVDGVESVDAATDWFTAEYQVLNAAVRRRTSTTGFSRCRRPPPDRTAGRQAQTQYERALEANDLLPFFVSPHPRPTGRIRPLNRAGRRQKGQHLRLR